jgi:hypothetical protein
MDGGKRIRHVPGVLVGPGKAIGWLFGLVSRFLS